MVLKIGTWSYNCSIKRISWNHIIVCKLFKWKQLKPYNYINEGLFNRNSFLEPSNFAWNINIKNEYKKPGKY